MNNTSRFKFYGILTALILVTVGVVWFYPRKEHSSKLPPTKKSVATKQVNRPPQQSVTSATQQPEMDNGQKRPRIILDPVTARAMGMNLPIEEQRKMALTPDQEKQLKVSLKAIKGDALEMLAGNASYQQKDDTTIVINTRLTQEQFDEIEKRLYKEVGGIIGDDKLQLIDSILLNGIRGACYAWGTGEMQFAMIGVDRNTAMGSNQQTEHPLKTAEAFAVKFDFVLPGDINYGWTYLCTSKDFFIKEYGALAVATLRMANAEGN